MPDNLADKTAAAVIVGNEILSGRTQEGNLAYIATGLSRLGIRVLEARVVGDVEEHIIVAVNACREAYDYVFVTGGIGPTHDDITSASVAHAFGVSLVRHPDALARLEERFKPADLNEARLSMADVPEGAELIDNPVSGAPGFRIGNVHVLAGVPSIMQAMLDSVIQGLTPGAPILSQAVACLLPEGMLASGLGAVQRRHSEVEIGSYPYFRQGRFGVTLVVRGRGAAEISAAIGEIKELIAELGGESVDTEL